MTEPSPSPRIQWIDILKGIVIILVVLGHMPCVNGRESILNNLIYSFHMDLFFALAGYTAAMSYSRHEGRGFIFRRVQTILIPYIAWCALRCYVLSGWNSHAFTLFYQTLWVGEGSLWFLPALFIVQIIFAFYMFICGKNATVTRKLLVFVIIALGMLCYHRYACPVIVSILPSTPDYLIPVFARFWPFALGVFVYQHQGVWKRLVSSNIFSVICLCIFIPFAAIHGQTALKIYGNIIIGLAGVFLFFKLLVYTPVDGNGILERYSDSPLCRQLLFIGKHSLGVYLLSDFMLPAHPFIPEYAGFPEFMIGFAYSVVVSYLCIGFECLVCVAPAAAAILYGKSWKNVFSL